MNHKVEFRRWSDIYINGDRFYLKKQPYSSDFGRIIEKIDKRLFNHWADGVTIFHFTQKQFEKFKKLISEYE